MPQSIASVEVTGHDLASLKPRGTCDSSHASIACEPHRRVVGKPFDLIVVGVAMRMNRAEIGILNCLHAPGPNIVVGSDPSRSPHRAIRCL